MDEIARRMQELGLVDRPWPPPSAGYSEEEKVEFEPTSAPIGDRPSVQLLNMTEEDRAIAINQDPSRRLSARLRRRKS